MSTLTPWFPPDIKPVHVGEYNASAYRMKNVFRWWNGEYWSAGYDRGVGDSIKITQQNTRCPHSWDGQIYWRGLTEPGESNA